MKYRIVLLCITLACAAGVRHRADGQSLDNASPHSRRDAVLLLDNGLPIRSGSDKRDCDQVYPLPDNYQNWTNCKKDGGGSGCGGPEQCACLESQRLITFTCDQGSYHQCFGEQGNGCNGN